MPNNDGKNRGWGENNGQPDPRRAEPRGPFEDDTDEAFTLPKPTPELSQDDDDGSDEKRADSAIDDLEIEVDEDELKAESESPGRKY